MIRVRRPSLKPILARVYALDPSWRELVPRLPKAGLLPDDAKTIEKLVKAGSR